MLIEVTQDPSVEDTQQLSRGIARYNVGIIGDLATEEDFRYFVFARDGDNEIIGGIRALAYWNCLTIELLWIDEHARGKGLGAMLLKEAEEYAVRHGFTVARVETTSFQARGFYKKQGYTLIGEIEDFPMGHTTILFKKSLSSSK